MGGLFFFVTFLYSSLGRFLYLIFDCSSGKRGERGQERDYSEVCTTFGVSAKRFRYGKAWVPRLKALE